MAIFDQELRARQEVAQRYSEGLTGVVEVPYVAPECTSVWAQYSVLSDAKPALMQKMKEAKIPAAVYYPLPLHLQGAFAHLPYKKGDFPASERAAQRIFSLPMHPYLNPADQERISLFCRF
ncbi:MAG: DegT/DnrJ/EryC1/StrS family aminotransferase [Desulfomonilaceae bacterium]